MSDTNEKSAGAAKDAARRNTAASEPKREIPTAPAPPPSATCPPTPHGLYECPAVHPDNKLPRADGEAGKVLTRWDEGGELCNCRHARKDDCHAWGCSAALTFSGDRARAEVAALRVEVERLEGALRKIEDPEGKWGEFALRGFASRALDAPGGERKETK